MGWTHRDDVPQPLIGREHRHASRTRFPRPADAPAAPLITAEEALAAGDRLLDVQAHTLGAVVALVPATAALFATMSRRRAVQSGVVLLEPGAAVDPRPLWQRYVSDVQTFDPFAPHLVAPADATVLMLEHVEERAARYVEQLHAEGWGDRLVVYLRMWGTIVATVSLLRASGRPRFTGADALALRRVQPLLEQVYAAAVQPARGGVRDLLMRSGLTPREAEVAELAARGASNGDIARSLYLSEATVKTHLTHIFTKLGVRTRTQLAVLAGGYEPGA